MTKSNSIDPTKLIEKKTKKRTALTFIVSVCALFVIIYFNLSVGSSHITFNDFMDYIWHHTDTKQTFLIHNVRMPRMLAALFIGAALGVAGLLMQAMTRNPLASPQIFGVNAGASFVIVFITMIVPALSEYATILAFVGAFIGGLTVYFLSGSTKGMTPVKLALAGMAIHLFFSSLTQGIILLNEDATSTVMFWLVGSLSTIQWPQIIGVIPWFVLAFIGAIAIAKQLTIMELGEDLATSLGQNVKLVRIATGLLVIVLAGASVSIAGPI